MSAHERRALAELARQLSAQDPALARALRTWSEPAQEFVNDLVQERHRNAERWRDKARAWLRSPILVASAGGVLTVGGLLLTAQVPDHRQPIQPAVTEAAIFTEQVPASVPFSARMHGP